MVNENPIRILIVEDLPTDAELAERELRKGGILFTSTRVETKDEFLKALETFQPDLIISDYVLPEFDGMQALKLSLARDVNLPFLLFTGSMNEETAVACMKAGATDYVIKEHITRLPYAVKEALEQAKMRLEKAKTERTLKKSEEKYRRLAEDMPALICTYLPDTMITFANAPVGCLVNKQPHELVGLRFLDLLPGDERESLRLRLMSLTSGEPIETHEQKHAACTGEVFWYQWVNRAFFDDKGVIQWYQAIGLDITARKQAEAKLGEVLGNLRTAMRTTIQVLVLAVETRDPYTAGHQRRVVDLARAIATEMKLPAEKIEGIRMAGAIHDIGKISIPTEILSKRATLSTLQYALVKAHAQYGYEILKDVESPWPLADMVRQHHERMDGSGYPQGLKGEEILIEARILAVADVVESMASHRPYRPALGIDAALGEIEQNKGVLYDPLVVDACIRIFREKGFQFATDSYLAKRET